MLDRMEPVGSYILDGSTHPDCVDSWRGSQSTDHDWNVIVSPGCVDNIGKQESPAVVLFYATQIKTGRL